MFTPLKDPPRAAAALLRRGLRHPGGHEAAHVAPLVVDELPSEAEVDDHAHLLHIEIDSRNSSL